MTNVLGVLIIARNGDRTEYYQDPVTYESSYTESTALGVVQSHQLGSFLRSTYMSSSSPSYIANMKTDLVDTHEVHVHAKAGGEGDVIFDSAVALLQGLFPPNPANKIVLANETTVVAPLGGYQYVPIQTVDPGNDRSLEPWIDCPAFVQHISNVYSSSEFKATAKAAGPFFGAVRDYVFGRPTTLENAIYDYISTGYSHNKTYAHRLLPTLVEQARGFADYHENAIFSDKHVGGIGNLAGRTILHTVLNSLQRIAFNGDPLQFLLVETSYQPFISLFHMLEMIKENPELAGIPNYASALAFELHRDFVRIKFKNGTRGDFRDLPRSRPQKQWAAACSSGLTDDWVHNGSQNAISSTVFAILAACFPLRHSARAKAQSTRIRLAEDEVTSTPDYGTLSNNIVAQPASMSEKQRLPL
ncbi:histidine phosphatase superfamily [Suillus subalutaceus]|uniref:histidine phosphatase superfamily n=1 Tax=Suillus subalutaceus TaxID=48586 RepID=UPI001B87BBF5|nr:histidine phosphatase superfamily [Suillus subalutaceus]KAG1837416.1 histidine phosphatase superfamily [Suillus subalutaceus]